MARWLLFLEIDHSVYLVGRTKSDNSNMVDLNEGEISFNKIKALTLQTL